PLVRGPLAPLVGPAPETAASQRDALVGPATAAAKEEGGRGGTRAAFCQQTWAHRKGGLTMRKNNQRSQNKFLRLQQNLALASIHALREPARNRVPQQRAELRLGQFGEALLLAAERGLAL